MIGTTEMPGARGFSVPLLISLIAGWVSVILYLCPGLGELPAEIVSVTSFFLAQALLPGCRMTLKPLVTPLNWLQFAFSLQLVVMPITVRIWGFAQSLFLLSRPTLLADNIAVLLMTSAYWSFCLAVHFTRSKPAGKASAQPENRWPLPSSVIWLFAVLGLVGIIAHYKTMTTFIHSLTDPASYIQETSRNGESASILDAMGDFFSSFLGTSIVMLWCRRLDLRARGGGRFESVGLLVLAAVAFAITGYNRANIVFPLVAASAVIGIRAPRKALRNFVVVGGLASSLVAATVIYRFSAHPEDVGAGPSVDVLNKINYMEFFQLYGKAPQYVAVMLDDSHYGLEPRFGRLSAASLLSQIPILGKDLRSVGGYAYYAKLVGRTDEVPSFAGEIFVDFNIVGVIVVFSLVGFATARLQQRVLHATHSFEIYAVQIVSTYLAASVLLCVEVLGQYFIYNMLPLYAYFLLRPLLRTTENG